MMELTDSQRRTLANALTLLAATVIFAFVAFLAWVVFKIISFTASAVVPVLLGFFLSLFFKPYYNWWLKLVGNPTLALLLMLLTVLAPLSVFLWYAGSVVVDQISNLLAQGPELVSQVTGWFRESFPGMHRLLMRMGVPLEGVEDFFAKYGSTALKAGSGALKCVSGAIGFLVSLIFFIFFLMTKERKGGDIVSQLPFFKEETKSFLALQIDTFFDILVSFFQRQTVICLIEGCMYGTGFLLVGLPYGFLIGFALGVLNIIPFFGSIVCLPLALPLAYFSGGSAMRLVLVLAVWLAGQLMDGYLITPKIQGNRTGLGYAGVIFSFFFWSIVLGPMLGLLLAIPLSAFCVVLWRAVKVKYLKPVV